MGPADSAGAYWKESGEGEAPLVADEAGVEEDAEASAAWEAGSADCEGGGALAAMSCAACARAADTRQSCVKTRIRGSRRIREERVQPSFML